MQDHHFQTIVCKRDEHDNRSNALLVASSPLILAAFGDRLREVDVRTRSDDYFLCGSAGLLHWRHGDSGPREEHPGTQGNGTRVFLPSLRGSRRTSLASIVVRRDSALVVMP